MATWRAAGTKATGSSVTSISVAPPAGHQAGDLLILLGHAYRSGGVTASTPAGWTLLASGDSGVWTDARSYVFWKIAASASEPNVTFTQAASGFPEAVMFAYQGSIDSVTPIDVSGGWGSAVASGNPTAPAITTVTDNALAVYIAAFQDGGVTGGTPPNSATQRYSDSQWIAINKEADVAKVTAGTLSAGVYTVTGSGSAARAFAFAIRPTVAAGPSFVPKVTFL